MKPVSQEITQEEIETLIQMGEREGTLETRESQMLKRISRFSDISVNEILHHRSLVAMVEENAGFDDVLDVFLSSNFILPSCLTLKQINRQFPVL